MKDLGNLIKDLEIISANDKDRHFIDNFENKLAEILASENPLLITKLLSFLRDDTDYDELMFSIIHTIESFNDEIYVKRIIDGLDELCNNSPRWASIIHIRIINSKPTLEAYISEMRKSSCSDRKLLNNLLNDIGKKGKKLEDKVKQLRRELLN